MRIAHVVSTFPPRVGGMGKVCYREARALASLGHQVEVFTLSYSGHSSERQTDGFTVNEIKALPRVGDGGYLPFLHLKLKGFDLVHLHYPFYVSAHQVFQAKKKWGVRYVVTYHMDSQSKSVFKKCVQGIYDKIWSEKIMNNAEAIIAVDSDYLKNSELIKQIDKEKITTIPNSVNTRIFRPLENVKREEKTLLFAGNPIAIKRLDILIEVLKEWPDKELKLSVAGGGYDLDKYKKMAESLNTADRVEFLGSLKEEEMVKVYNTASCLCVPSESESFSLVAVEAMACGCPVVANNISGIKDKIQDTENGFIVKENSASEWVRVLEKFFSLSKQEKEKMSLTAIKRVKESYGLEKHIKSLLKIYEEILKQ